MRAPPANLKDKTFQDSAGIQFAVDEIMRDDIDEFAGDFRGRNGSAQSFWRDWYHYAVFACWWAAC